MGFLIGFVVVLVGGSADDGGGGAEGSLDAFGTGFFHVGC
jgi:hypothetical protein